MSLDKDDPDTLLVVQFKGKQLIKPKLKAPKSLREPIMDHLHQNGAKQAQVAVVIVPVPAQGHLNQQLHLSRLISAYGIHVHYVGSATHNLQAKRRVHGWDPLSISNIHFHDFPIPPYATPFPDPHATIKFPVHLQPALEASLNLRQPLAALLHCLSSITHRVAVIHDPLMAFAAEEAASLPNVEGYSLNNTSALASLFFWWEDLKESTNEGILMPKDLPQLSMEGCFPSEFMNFVAGQIDKRKFEVGELFNTCRSMESKFIDLLAQDQFKGHKRQWSIGPLNPVIVSPKKDSHQRHKCLEWLDKQPPKSVIYISFGTTLTIPDDQILELAIGLEKSKQRFIWVLREADRGDIYAEDNEVRRSQLPIGYEERVEGMGLIERDWAPQLEILAHPSTGGFISHCGWNSCMESLSMGVPIAAWPMHSDQPWNTLLVTEVLRVGLIVREWEKRLEMGLVSAETVESTVKKLMASEEGEDMRRRAKELGIAVRQSVSEGGSSWAELDAFIAHISRV